MNFSCIRPTYLKNFQCDGKACQSNCCGNWRVTVDQDTLRKYMHMEPEQERERILSHIIFRKQLQSFGITMDKNGRCPFLGEDYLCSIQKRYGEAYISDICVTYPRVFYQIGELLEESLTVTCPVAARLILFSGEPVRFEKVSVPYPRKTQVAQWTDKVKVFERDWQRIQETCIGLLQDRRYSMDERFLRMLFLLDRLDQPELTEKFSVTEIYGDEGFMNSAAEFRDFSAENHVRFLSGLFARVYLMKLTEEKIIALERTYEEARGTVLPILGALYGQSMENYLVNEFFLRFYPFAFRGTLLYNGKLFVIAGKLVEFSLLVTAIAKGGNLTEEDFLQVVERVSERLDHSRDGMAFLKDSISVDSSDESVLDFASYMLNLS